MMTRMENVNRRDVFLGLAAMAAGLATAEGQAAGEDVLSTSRSYQFDELKVNQSANGGASRPVVTGVLATGERVEVHETSAAAGADAASAA